MIDRATTDFDLHKILELQKKNFKDVLSSNEIKSEGFVTVRHDFDLLKKMNSPYPHIIAREGEEIAGFCLCMLPSLKDDVPVLHDMFSLIEDLRNKDNSLIKTKYVVMGQVCIAKEYRGQGIFKMMYDELKNQLSSHFDMVITEVSRQNPRSMKAHLNQGFKIIHSHEGKNDELWDMVIWDWS